MGDIFTRLVPVGCVSILCGLFFLERSPRGCTPPNLRPEIFRRCPVVVFFRLTSVLACLVVVCWHRLTLLPSHCPGLFVFVFRQDRSLASTPSRSSHPPFGHEPTRTPFAVSGVGLGQCWFARPTAVPRFHRSTRRAFLCERSHCAQGRFGVWTRTSREGSPWGDEDVWDLLPCPTQGGRGVGRDQLGRRIPSPHPKISPRRVVVDGPDSLEESPVRFGVIWT